MAMGSNSKVAMALVALCCMMFVTQAAEYHVRWIINMQGWGKGRSFAAGDVLVFDYAAGAHNVVKVDQTGYNTCRPSAGAPTYTSGHDRIMLHRGTNLFICSFPGHCNGGMKIAVTAH
ncbi:hypothetical protein QOZ80_2AG0108210 [Eleusine coracana subsp. coracana]|nr:hypothetical protein QOZ80_2AG0108210 [Eleusine coracana subsp. coracana]